MRGSVLKSGLLNSGVAFSVLWAFLQGCEGPGLRIKGLPVLCRVDISDTLMYVYEMLGAELLSNLYDKLGRLLTSSEEPYSWQVPRKPDSLHTP